MAIFRFIADFLNSIADIFISLFGFVIQVIKGLLSVFQMLPKFITYITMSIGFLPSMLSVFATATVAIAIIYFVIGRNTND